MISVLLAEDNPADVLLIREAIKLQRFDFELFVQRNGEEITRFVDRLDAREMDFLPQVILLDLNLPRTGGESVLHRIRRSPLLAEVPVIVVTSSDSPKDREAVAAFPGTNYFRKPSDLDAFLQLGALIKDVLGIANNNHR